MTFSFKGNYSDGPMKLDIRKRATYDGCRNQYTSCYGTNCGWQRQVRLGVIDQSTNAPTSNRQWCETEESTVWTVINDKPFQMRASSCCWIPTRNGASSWRWDGFIDLGMRSDTGQHNQSPKISILPFLRVPENCPRTYKLMSYDPDGDEVRCRYGNIRNVECAACNQPSGFHLSQDSCTLHYLRSSANPRVHAFEMVVEDFSKKHMALWYKDGTRSHRHPIISHSYRRKRNIGMVAVTTPTHHVTNQNWWGRWGWTTTSPPTRNPQPPNSWWWWTTTTSPPIRNPQPPNSWWWWTTTTSPPTRNSQLPNSWWWWTTTTSPPTRNPQPPNSWWWWTTTTSPPTRNSQLPNSWWWWTTTTSPPTRNPQPPNSWWWWTTTTSPPTRNPQPPNPWSMWRRTTTTTQPYLTTRPLWWWWGHTTQSTTARNPWWLRTTSPPPKKSFDPFSKLPLQFSLLVDPPAPSCQEGHYIPKLVHPTPEEGERIIGVLNKVVEIRVKAQTAFSTIHDIIISGPMHVTKRRTTHNEFVIELMPNEDDLGEIYPVCFAVEAVSGQSSGNTPTPSHHSHHYHPTLSSQSGVYQSEMRCVLLQIVKSHIKTNVICNESSMQVEVKKSSFEGLAVDRLRLSDPSNTICSLMTHSNSTHLIGVIPLNACGTQIEEDDNNLIFKNEITTVDNVNDLITRKHLLELQFYCQYPKRGNVTLSFIGHRKKFTVWERGFGTFTYQFEFYRNEQYRSMINPNTYPLDYELGTRIYMQIEASPLFNNTEMFVESCRAAPFDNPNYSPSYSIIENGCVIDPTTIVYTSNQTQYDKRFQFSMEAFSFIGLYDQVYISCSIIMCEAGNPDTRCSKGCMNAPWPIGHNPHHRHRREAVIQSQNHLVSQGPLRLARSADERQSSGRLNSNLTLVFLAGCVLAAVGIICGLIAYKIKMSSIKYQHLPVSDT